MSRGRPRKRYPARAAAACARKSAPKNNQHLFDYHIPDREQARFLSGDTRFHNVRHAIHRARGVDVIAAHPPQRAEHNISPGTVARSFYAGRREGVSKCEMVSI